MELASAAALIDDYQRVPRRGPVRPTMMELSGYPHYEYVCSNILAFFFDPSAPHGLGSLCLNALLASLDIAEIHPALSNVTVEREVETDTGNRLDILVSSDSHLVAIENKIFAKPANPFADYAALVAAKAGDRRTLKILLTLYPPSLEPGHGFVCISYARFIATVRSQFGHYIRGTDARYLVYLADFLDTIENLERGTQMDPAWLVFIREHEDALRALMVQIRSFKGELRNRVIELGSMIDTRQRSNTRQWFYRETEELADTLVHDIRLAPDLLIAVDTTISPGGWEIKIFARPGGNMAKLGDLLRSLNIPFQDGERLVYTPHFGYSEKLEDLQCDLQTIIDKLGAANAIS